MLVTLATENYRYPKHFISKLFYPRSSAVIRPQIRAPNSSRPA